MTFCPAILYVQRWHRTNTVPRYSTVSALLYSQKRKGKKGSRKAYQTLSGSLDLTVRHCRYKRAQGFVDWLKAECSEAFWETLKRKSNAFEKRTWQSSLMTRDSGEISATLLPSIRIRHPDNVTKL